MKKVIFNGLEKIIKKQIVWNYDEDANVAKYFLALPYDNDLLTQLLSVQSIIVTKLDQERLDKEIGQHRYEIKIMNVEQFKVYYPLAFLIEQDVRLRRTDPGSVTSSPSLFRTPSAKATLSRTDPNPEFSTNSLTLDWIIPPSDKNAWSDTLSYEDYFSKISPAIPKFVHSMRSIFLINQQKTNQKIYPLRKELIILFRLLFDDYLSTTFKTLQTDKEIPTTIIESLKQHFRTFIWVGMRFWKANDNLTDSEKLDLEEREDYFKNNQEHYKQAVMEERKLRSKHALLNFVFFIDETIDLNHCTQDTTIHPYLKEIKAQLASNEAFKKLVHDMIDIHVLLGQAQYEIKQNTQRLKDVLKIHEPYEDMYSMHQLLKNAGKDPLPIIKKLINELNDYKTIETQPFLAKDLIGDDNDFYVCSELYFYLERELNPKKTKDITPVLKEKIVSWLETKIAEEQQPVDSIDTPQVC